MPAIQFEGGLRSGLVFLALALAIPLQLYLSKETAVPTGEREAIFRRLVHSAHDLKTNYLSVSSWRRWCVKLMNKVSGWRTGTQASDSNDDDRGESPAVEVLHYRDPNGYFATSPLVRSPRPPEVKFRVGQVVKHKRHGYRGVIIGWDPVAHAPQRWMREMHPPDKLHWQEMPNYSILIDSRDEPGDQMAYVPQENLEPINNMEVQHKSVGEYFDAFDGSTYIMRPGIQQLYPHD